MEAVLELFKRLGLGKVIAIGSVVVILVVVFGVILAKYNDSPMILLYSNLEIEDTNKIVAELERKKINYQLGANGTQILVADSDALRIRMDMAQAGIPSKGNIIGYEVFDKNDSFSSSNFVQNVQLLRALEGELSRTIGSFETIKKARVHLVIPKRELFSKEYQQPSASVVLDMKNPNNTLNKEEVNAISHLVSTAVPGLDINRITIVDTKGKSLKTSDDDPAGLGSMSNTQDFRIAYEYKLKKTIEELLEKYVGKGKVEAQISADLDFDRVVTNSESYDPDGQVARSIQAIEEKESNKEKSSSQDSSVTNNLPNVPNSNADSGDQQASNAQRTDETTNYEISKTVKNHISESGKVKRLSIAILVDGIYEKDKDTGQLVYSARKADELKKLESLVKSAVGFNEERNDHIEIVNLQFSSNLPEEIAKESLADWLKEQLSDKIYTIIKTTIFGMLLIAFIVLFIRPIFYKVFDAAAATVQAQVDAEVALAKAHVEAANLKTRMEYDTHVKAQAEEELIEVEKVRDKAARTFKNINDLVTQCPKETVFVIRNWLNS